ncbi:MAG: ribosome small subunit-dependent GTPase A [Myxococcota bacterium]|nr:ribosome small subunit-dependent GTPase A [Myxococcota bacterium]
MGRKNRQGASRRRDSNRAVERKRREREEREERDRSRLLERFADLEPDGRVLCQFGTHAETALSDGTVRLCMLSPKVHKLFGICVGDVVWTQRGATDEERIIVARAARRTEVRRKRGEEDRTGHVIAANVDVMAITVSLREPPLRTGAIDRYLVLASVLGLDPLLILTKIDQAPPHDPGWQVLEPYRELGIPILATSAASGEGLQALRQELQGSVSVFAGHSGVGKSSLCQALGLAKAPPVGELSTSGGRVRGRHTTSIARLLELPEGGWVVDTPGVRAIGLVDLRAEDARIHFPEFESFGADCAYSDCSHRNEDDCAVRAASGAGRIPTLRYEGYLRLMESLED